MFTISANVPSGHLTRREKGASWLLPTEVAAYRAFRRQPLKRELLKRLQTPQSQPTKETSPYSSPKPKSRAAPRISRRAGVEPALFACVVTLG
jgi:hypothetical protein